ncbi:hypothetical protein C3L33_01173, partial [Rhododendron williamsianum]
MGRRSMGFLADPADAEMIDSDINELKIAAKRLISHATKLGGLGFGTSFLKWVASFAAICTGYFRKLASGESRQTLVQATNPGFLLQLLVDTGSYKLENQYSDFTSSPLYFLQPSFGVVQFLKVGKWIAFIAVVLRLFFPRHFPDWLEMPGSLILLLVVAPSFFADTLKDSWVGVAICLIIGCYLLQEHIRVSGGFRNSFTQPHGVSNTVGIILLLVYPLWALVLKFV